MAGIIAAFKALTLDEQSRAFPEITAVSEAAKGARRLQLEAEIGALGFKPGEGKSTPERSVAQTGRSGRVQARWRPPSCGSSWRRAGISNDIAHIPAVLCEVVDQGEEEPLEGFRGVTAEVIEPIKPPDVTRTFRSRRSRLNILTRRAAEFN
jgi:hypothetical protein